MPKLTRREKEIFSLLLDGLVPKEIAGKLKISYETVVSHQKKLYYKLDIHSINELLDKYQDNKSAALDIAEGIPIIYLEDETFFRVHTYNQVYFFPNIWSKEDKGEYGEMYFTGDRIKLNDIYSGTINNLIPDPDINNFFNFKVTGIIDKQCKNININIDYVTADARWNNVCTTDGRKVSIGPGSFSENIGIRLNAVDINSLPEGGQFILSLYENIYYTNNYYIFESGQRIPSDMPDNEVWAVVDNLKIEPVDKLAK